MFRPNRVGTPNIHNNASLSDTSAFTLNENNVNQNTYLGNVINAAPVLDFGRSPLRWAGAARTFTSANKWILGQQFTITEPLNGDVVGLELMAGIVIGMKANALIRPVLCRLTAAGGAVLAQVSSQDTLTQIEKEASNPTAGSAAAYMSHYYRTTALVSYPTGTVGGVYMHGFEFTNPDAAAASVTFFQTTMAVRQLNDQQNINYRDSLR